MLLDSRLRRLATYLYVQDLLSGAAVLDVGGDAAEMLRSRGARSVRNVTAVELETIAPGFDVAFALDLDTQVLAGLVENIKRILKHPMLVGVKLWAVAHLCANGDIGGIILFGTVLAWAVYDRISLKHRSDPGAPPIKIGGLGNDIIAIILGTILYAVLGLVFHPLVIGLPAFGTSALAH